MTERTGRPPVLKKGIEDFLDAVEEARSDEAAVRELTAAVRSSLLEQRTPASAKLYLSKYRAAAVERFGADHPVVKGLSGAGIKTHKRKTTNDPIGVVLAALLKELREAEAQEEVSRICEAYRARIIADWAPASASSYLSEARRLITDQLGKEHPALPLLSGAGILGNRPAAESRPAVHITAAQIVERSETLNIAGGRPPALQAQIAKFMEALRSARTKKDVQALWDEEFARHSDKTDATRLNYVSKYRNEVRAAFGDDHKWLEVIQAPRELSDRVAERRAETLAQQHRELVLVPQWKAIVERGRTLLKSEDPLEIGLGLLIVTGRRPVEVFTTGEFARMQLRQGSRAYTKWSVTFAGQAKTRGKAGTQHDKAYEIPVLAPADEVVQAFERLRAHPKAQTKLAITATHVPTLRWAEMTPEDFKRSNSVYGRIVTAMKGDDEHEPMFADLWPGDVPLTAYDFRALYAEIAYLMFAPKTVSKNSYFNGILGHTAKDIETGLSYMRFALPEEADASSAHSAEKTMERVQARTLTLLKDIHRI